jgi:hypothetical protein
MKALKTAAEGGQGLRDPRPAITPSPPRQGSAAISAGVAKGQLADQLTNAIFATPIGKVSDVVTVAGDGTYLFKVLTRRRGPGGAAAR